MMVLWWPCSDLLKPCSKSAMAIAIPRRTFTHCERTACKSGICRAVARRGNLGRLRTSNLKKNAGMWCTGQIEGLGIAARLSWCDNYKFSTIQRVTFFVPKRNRFEAMARHRDHKVKVRMRLDHQVSFGDKHALLGSVEHLGGWQSIVSMEWTKDGWLADLEMDPGEAFEYKYLIVSGNGQLTWENGRNRTMVVPSSFDGHYEVVSHWNATQEEIRYERLSGGNLETKKAEESEEVDKTQMSKLEFVRPEPTIDIGSSFVHQWRGEEITTMKSNEHLRQRTETRDTSGLGAPANQIVEGDKKSANWLLKLEVVCALLTGALSKEERLESLINASIYLKLAKEYFYNVYRAAKCASMMTRTLKARVLQWINTGQIQCREDGGHHRPNKHAEISRQIFKELERLTADKAVSPKEYLVVRKIQPLLPAFKAEFTAPVPLTRIRDIAHRNDIPHDLKTEIKHTIQNKLHRNAGPEDLVATEIMLARLSKIPGEYSRAFVEQFKIFYDELKDFFNASSLADQIESVRNLADGFEAQTITSFLESKKDLEMLNNRAEKSAEKGLEMLLCTLQNVAMLRTAITKRLGKDVTSDISDDAVATRQKWRLCEIGLEDYSFVLLSRFINFLEESGGADWLVKDVMSEGMSAWTQSLKALVLGLRQIELSGWLESECNAIQSEITAWQSDIASPRWDEDDHENKKSARIAENLFLWAKRLKASLDRCRRLAESFTETLLELYSQRAERLGRAFGIPLNSVKTYTEAEIRASVMFQLSKLVSLLLKATRRLSGLEGWDAIMPGRTVGTLFEVDRIVPGSIPLALDSSVILLVKMADGDEEVKAAGETVAGVILCHEIPHLSHLGVRARQEKVVFVTLDDDEKVSSLKSLLGKKIQLDVTAEGASVSQTDVDSNTVLKSLTIKEQGVQTERAAVVRSAPGVVLDLVNGRKENSGSKAAVCGGLAVLAEASTKVQVKFGAFAAFKVPHGLVIPFGAMEDALEAAGCKEAFENLVERTEIMGVERGELDSVCRDLRELISRVRPLKSVVDSVVIRFHPTARLIARSSANVEDLAGLSGAGLYESVPNVQCSNPDAFGRAVAEVWASLYSRRAVLSRRAAGIPQKEAAMSVFIQELLSPDLSFVLHTMSPVDADKNVVQAEIAAGLGETLASGTRGSPWRLSVDKLSGSVKTLAFANFSDELVLQKDGPADMKVSAQTVDYSTKSLSVDPVFRKCTGQRLAAIGCYLEQQLGGAQDVEGCIVGADVYIVQARPQP